MTVKQPLRGRLCKATAEPQRRERGSRALTRALRAQAKPKYVQINTPSQNTPISKYAKLKIRQSQNTSISKYVNLTIRQSPFFCCPKNV